MQHTMQRTVQRPMDPGTPHGHGRYTSIAIALHWLMAAMIVSALTLGYYMSGLPFSPSRLRLFSYHKWLGITILAIAAVRLLWRLGHRPPALPAMAAWQRNGAHVAHGLLYLLFFAVPLSGWAYSSAAGFPVVYFGVLPLPDWVSPDKALAARLVTVHAVLAYSLAAVVVVHIAAALKHGFEEPVGYLQRMLPGRP